MRIADIITVLALACFFALLFYWADKEGGDAADECRDLKLEKAAIICRALEAKP